jgi:hypothetical protein
VSSQTSWQGAVCVVVLAVVASAAAAAGTVSVEPGVAFRVAEERSWAGRTFRRVGLPQLPGWRVVVGHDLKTLTRSSGRILLMGSRRYRRSWWTSSGPAACRLRRGWAARWSRRDCARPTLGVIATCPELGRLLGLSSGSLVGARLAVPAIAGVLWAALSLGLLGGTALAGPWWQWALTGVAAGTCSWVR